MLRPIWYNITFSKCTYSYLKLFKLDSAFNVATLCVQYYKNDSQHVLGIVALRVI